jgi:hypothetical protein
MAEFAARGKTSVGWFYGFKLHLVINDQGELLAVKKSRQTILMTVTRYPSWRAPYLANSLVTGATFRSHSLSNCRSKVCSSSPKYEKT